MKSKAITNLDVIKAITAYESKKSLFYLSPSYSAEMKHLISVAKHFYDAKDQKSAEKPLNDQALFVIIDILLNDKSTKKTRTYQILDDLRKKIGEKGIPFEFYRFCKENDIYTKEAIYAIYQSGNEDRCTLVINLYQEMEKFVAVKDIIPLSMFIPELLKDPDIITEVKKLLDTEKLTKENFLLLCEKRQEAKSILEKLAKLDDHKFEFITLSRTDVERFVFTHPRHVTALFEVLKKMDNYHYNSESKKADCSGVINTIRLNPGVLLPFFTVFASKITSETSPSVCRALALNPVDVSQAPQTLNEHFYFPDIALGKNKKDDFALLNTLLNNKSKLDAIIRVLITLKNTYPDSPFNMDTVLQYPEEILRNIENYRLFPSVKYILFTRALELDNPVCLSIIKHLDTYFKYDLTTIMLRLLNMTYQQTALQDFLFLLKRAVYNPKNPHVFTVDEWSVNELNYDTRYRFNELFNEFRTKEYNTQILNGIFLRVEQQQTLLEKQAQPWGKIGVLASFVRANLGNPLKHSVVALLKDKSKNSIFGFLYGAKGKAANTKELSTDKDATPRQSKETKANQTQPSTAMATTAQASNTLTAPILEEPKSSTVTASRSAASLFQPPNTIIKKTDEPSSEQKISDAFHLLIKAIRPDNVSKNQNLSEASKKESRQKSVEERLQTILSPLENKINEDDIKKDPGEINNTLAKALSLIDREILLAKQAKQQKSASYETYKQHINSMMTLLNPLVAKQKEDAEQAKADRKFQPGWSSS